MELTEADDLWTAYNLIEPGDRFTMSDYRYTAVLTLLLTTHSTLPLLLSQSHYSHGNLFLDESPSLPKSVFAQASLFNHLENL